MLVAVVPEFSLFYTHYSKNILIIEFFLNNSV